MNTQIRGRLGRYCHWKDETEQAGTPAHLSKSVNAIDSKMHTDDVPMTNAQPKRSSCEPNGLPPLALEPPPIMFGTMRQKRFLYWLRVRIVSCIEYCLKKRAASGCTRDRVTNGEPRRDR